jgi:hypothetical protein
MSATTKHQLRDLLHGATHRVPGVPAHVEHPAGHQGRARAVRATHERDRAHGGGHGGVRNGGVNHSPARPPRVLVGWQRRIAAFFGQEV